MGLDVDFCEVFELSIEEYDFECAKTLIDSNNFVDFQRLLNNVTFSLDINHNALLHHACRSGHPRFVKELLNYPSVVSTLSSTPEIMVTENLAPDIVLSLIDSLQRDYVMNDNIQFINWLVAYHQRDLAIRFVQEADSKYRRPQQLAIEYKPDVIEDEFNMMMAEAPDMLVQPQEVILEEEQMIYAPDCKRKRLEHEIRKNTLLEPPEKRTRYTPNF